MTPELSRMVRRVLDSPHRSLLLQMKVFALLMIWVTLAAAQRSSSKYYLDEEGKHYQDEDSEEGEEENNYAPDEGKIAEKTQEGE